MKIMTKGFIKTELKRVSHTWWLVPVILVGFFLLGGGEAQAAEGIVNLCSKGTSATGGLTGNGCVVCGADGQNGWCSYGGISTLKVYTCDSDLNPKLECHGNNGGSMPGLVISGSGANRWVETNSYPNHCKVQIDFFPNSQGMGNPTDWVVYKNSSKCTTTVGYTLSVSVSGSGSVTSSPTGISCGSGTCTASYNSGTSVTLTATPASGAAFYGWSGGGCSGTGACTVYMNQNRSVSASFSSAPVRNYTPISPANGATVSTTPTFTWSTNNPFTYGGYSNVNICNRAACNNPDVIAQCGVTGSGTSCTYTGTALNPGTQYWWLVYGYNQRSSNPSDTEYWAASPIWTFTTASNSPPTTSSVEINGNPVVPNTNYTITMTSNDPNGGNTIVSMNAGPNIINNSYSGLSPDLAGYLGWTSLSRPPYWANDGDQWRNCSGGGHGVRNTQFSGYNKINLNNCSTSVSGNTRTVRFEVSFTSAFTGPNPSYLWGWVADAFLDGDPVTPSYYGWRRFGSFNVTQPVQPITWTINEKAICTNGAPDPDSHGTRLWWVMTGSAPWPSGISGQSGGMHSYSITSTTDPQYMYFGMDDGTDSGNLQLTGNPPDSRITYGGYFGVNPRGVAMFKRDLPAPGPYTFYFAAPVSWCPLKGTLTVNTVPSGGAVYVGGSYWGTAPQTRSDMTPYNYTVSFGNNLPGYAPPSSRTVIVRPNQETRETGTYTAQTYTVSTSAGAGGSISPTSASVSYGSTTSFTVTPNSGYRISGISGCGGGWNGVTSTTTYTTGAVYGNCTVSAGFALSSYTVSTSAGAGGSISPSSRVVTAGSSTSFTVSPNSGYYTSSASGCGGYLSGNTYYTGAITGNCTVSASFALYYYTVTMTAGSGGSVSPGSRSVGYGGTGSFTVTPSTGYHIASVSGCGGSLSGSTYTTGAIYGSCTATATFAINSYTVSINASPAGTGTFTPASSTTVNYGGTTYFDISPAAHYHLTSASGCGGSLSGARFTTGAITGTCTVTANFAINNGTLNVTSSGLVHAPYTISGDATTYYTDTTPSKTLAPGPYTVTFLAVSGYLVTTPNPVSVTVNPAPDPAASAAATYTATADVTVEFINDNNGDGTKNGSDGTLSLASGQHVRLSCATTASIPCPANPIVFTGPGSAKSAYPLAKDGIYTFGFTQNDSYNDPYKTLTNVLTDGTVRTNPVDVNPAVSSTVDFLVTANNPAWFQVWDGDVYGGFSNPANPSFAAISVSVPDAPAPSYHKTFLQTNSTGAGGLVLTRTGTVGAVCDVGTCSENGWLIKDYANELAWPEVVDSITASDTNLCYTAGSLNINTPALVATYSTDSSPSGCANKVAIVNGDLTFDGTNIPGPIRHANALFVVKGKVTFTNVPSSVDPWIINGGIISKNSPSADFDFSYSLDDNKTPAVQMRYNPAILIATTPLFTATYTWREVTP